LYQYNGRPELSLSRYCVTHGTQQGRETGSATFGTEHATVPSATAMALTAQSTAPSVSGPDDNFVDSGAHDAVAAGPNHDQESPARASDSRARPGEGTSLGTGGQRLTGLGRSIGHDGKFLAWSPLAALSRSPSLRLIDRAGGLLWTNAEEEGGIQPRTAKDRGDISGSDNHVQLSDELRTGCLWTGVQPMRSICRDGNLASPSRFELSPAVRAIDCSGNFLGHAKLRFNWSSSCALEGAGSCCSSSEGSQCDRSSYSESIASAAGTEHHCDSQDEETSGPAGLRGVPADGRVGVAEPIWA